VHAAPFVHSSPILISAMGNPLRACEIYTTVISIDLFILYTCLAMPIDAPLTFDSKAGKNPDTWVFCLSGPLTLRNLFEIQAELRSVPLTRLIVIDLSGVPYMDSAGMGLVMNHYVHCQTRGSKLVVAGANSRVMDLFKITRVDSVLPLTASLEGAELSN
jgi:anti-sigma B factor antagonist